MFARTCQHKHSPFKKKKKRRGRSRTCSVKDIPEAVVDPPRFHGTFSPHSTGNTILPVLPNQSSPYSLQIWFCEEPSKITDNGSHFWLTALPVTLPFEMPPCTHQPPPSCLSQTAWMKHTLPNFAFFWFPWFSHAVSLGWNVIGTCECGSIFHSNTKVWEE